MRVPESKRLSPRRRPRSPRYLASSLTICASSFGVNPASLTETGRESAESARPHARPRPRLEDARSARGRARLWQRRVALVALDAWRLEPRACRLAVARLLERRQLAVTRRQRRAMFGSKANGDAKYAPLNGARVRSRPPSPPGPDRFSFSTTLRRAEDAEAPFSLLGSAVEAAASAVRPTPRPPGHSRTHSGGFAHTAKASTPSARFSRAAAAAVVSELTTSATTGLESHRVAAIRKLAGPNEFAVAPKESAWRHFAGQFTEQPLNMLLLASAVVSAFFGNYDDAISITLAILIVVTGSLLIASPPLTRPVAFVQERRSEKSLEALNKLVPHYCHVMRCVRSIAPI